MKGATLFSGIGSPEAAAPQIDWRWCAEIDPFASAVHARHFPHVRNLGDVRTIDPGAVEPVDLVVMGPPCQSFSVAGKRAGLRDHRGNLALVGLALAGRLRPTWVVVENVPGLLSSHQGRDFGTILGMLAEHGYGFAYGVLDAQWFGVPQRRRRVFVVGCLGDWHRAAEVLFERESLRGDSPPRRTAGQGVAPSIESGANRTGGSRPPGTTVDTADSLVAHPLGAKRDGGWRGDLDNDTLIPIQYAEQLGREKRHNGMGLGDPGDPMYTLERRQVHGIAHSLRAEGFDASEDGTGRGVPLVTALDWKNSAGGPNSRDAFMTLGVERTPAIAFDARQSDGTGPLDTDGTSIAVAFAERTRRDGRNLETQADLAYALTNPGSGGRTHSRQILAPQAYDITGTGPGVRNGGRKTDIHTALRACKPPGMSEASTTTVVATPMAVRRLLPAECEKLQGFPPGWTAIDFRGKPAADGNRYRSLGNAMAVPVIAWLLKRLHQVDKRLFGDQKSQLHNEQAEPRHAQAIDARAHAPQQN